MSKTLMTIAFALLISSQAFAINKYRATEHTCEELQQIVQTEGEVFIQGRIGGNIYVADQSYCDRSNGREIAVVAYDRSQDKRFCQIGFVCQQVHGGGH